MRAAVIDGFGGPEALHLAEVPTPSPGPTDVLIRVHSAGVGSWDADERAGGFQGEYADPASFPYILGWDGAGTVAAVGDDVERFAVGDRVCAATTASPRGGFYAEYAVVDQEHVAPVPEGMPLDQAGAMPWDSVTAMSGLEALDLQPGETLLIFGASGGIGHFALQLARRWRVRIVAVASGADGVSLSRRLGADLAVDGRSEDVASAVRDFAPDGVDAVLLTAGGPAAELMLSLRAPGGRASCPHGVDRSPESDKTVRFFSGDRSSDGFRRLARLVADGEYEVALGGRYRFSQAAEAHRAVSTHHPGKIVLLPDDA